MAADANLRSWLALRSVHGVGDLTARRLWEVFGSGEAALRASSAALEDAGFAEVTYRDFTFGIVSLHIGRKPA